MNSNKSTAIVLQCVGAVLLMWWFYRVTIMPKPAPTPIGVVAPAPTKTVPTKYLLPAGIIAFMAARHFSEG